MAGPTNWTSVLTPKNGEIDRHSFRQRLCFYLNKSAGFGYKIYLYFRANILSVKSTWTIIKSGLVISPIGFIFLAILATQGVQRLIMNETLFGSPLFASALFGVAMFFFFRWVFVERYSAEEAKNYAILIAFVCAVITWGAFG